jgi:hypothetical protein
MIVFITGGWPSCAVLTSVQTKPQLGTLVENLKKPISKRDVPAVSPVLRSWLEDVIIPIIVRDLIGIN